VQQLDGQLVLSPTDVSKHLACRHLTSLDLEVSAGHRRAPVREDAAFDVLTRRGTEHERRYLDLLRAQGLSVVTIEVPRERGTAALLAAEQRTLETMREGVDVIYQATFFDGRWLGFADFLRRIEAPSDLGAHSYEVEDTKLAKQLKPAAVLQLCTYAEQLERLQGVAPEQVHVVLGDLTRRSIRLADVAAYHRRVTNDFERRLAEPTETHPLPVAHCGQCRWEEVCTERWQEVDHLSLVAGARGSQIERLEQHGITTLEELATTDLDGIPQITDNTYERLRAQARLQLEERRTGKRTYELLAPEPARGLALLPRPSPGDLFLDLEGDPFVGPAGLEYLFGLVEIGEDGSSRFLPFWAHDEAEEKVAFEQVIDFITDRLDRDPGMHVYHYAAYEQTAFKRLMGRHATREEEVDRLLRGGVLVDLYRVVGQGLRVSAGSYSIKELEPLYMDTRDGAVTDAGSSIVAYEEWLANGDPRTLDDIERYNEDDCVSTRLLRDWLEERRLEAERVHGIPLARPVPDDGQPSEELRAAELEVAGLVEGLTGDVPDEVGARSEDEAARWLLAQLLGYHRREARSEWWAFFERLDMTMEELYEDAESVADLRYEGAVDQVRRSLIHRYRYDPDQEHKLRIGAGVLDPETKSGAGTLCALDTRQGVVDLQRVKTSEVPHPRAVVAPGPVDTTPKRKALQRVAAAVLAHGLDGPHPYPAAADLLRARPPRRRRHSTDGPLRADDETELEAAKRLASELDGGCLPVQGPPGAGKTYTAARVVLDHVQSGRRVGVTALSHKAIGNLLGEICQAAREEGVALRVLQNPGKGEPCDDPLVQVGGNPEVEAALGDGVVDVVAGSSWLFSREELEGSFDLLVVDEASQLPLADAVAVSTAARNLLLVGDPQQLGQPSKGSHPPGSDGSALSHLIGDHATVPDDRGLFLATSRRMHSGVCDFVSNVVYEGRLTSHPDCDRQTLAGTGPWSGTGLRWLPVQHTGHRTSSCEEIAAVADVVGQLIGAPWTRADGTTVLLGPEDVLVVAPYNAHVTRLLEALPDGVEAGTVDRFQGRQAPVTIYSMASSSPELAPRGLDFLYSLERLNVAVSRAQGMSILVCNPALLLPMCRTLEQMRRANALCRFVELADCRVMGNRT
jgi:predicted RecB family nuclease